MQEQLRRDYLQAMGIPVLVPRRELPFAAPSRLLDAERTAAAERESSDSLALTARLHGKASAMAVLDDLVPPPRDHGQHQSEANQRSESAFSDSLSLTKPEVGQPFVASSATPLSGETVRGGVNLSPKVAEDVTLKLVEAAEPPNDTPLVDLTPPRFELHFVLTGAVLWVCDEPADFPALRQFAGRVAMAMKYPQETLAPVSFQWPFIENPREDQSIAVARQALTAQWSFFEHHGAKALVGFGHHVCLWAEPLCGSSHIVEASVSRVMSDAELKRALWLRLRSWSLGASGD